MSAGRTTLERTYIRKPWPLPFEAQRRLCVQVVLTMDGHSIESKRYKIAPLVQEDGSHIIVL